MSPPLPLKRTWSVPYYWTLIPFMIQGGVEILLVASCYTNRVSSGLMGLSARMQNLKTRYLKPFLISVEHWVTIRSINQLWLLLIPGWFSFDTVDRTQFYSEENWVFLYVSVDTNLPPSPRTESCSLAVCCVPSSLQHQNQRCLWDVCFLLRWPGFLHAKYNINPLKSVYMGKESNSPRITLNMSSVSLFRKWKCSTAVSQKLWRFKSVNRIIVL